jgi:hypothetical protein
MRTYRASLVSLLLGCSLVLLQHALPDAAHAADNSPKLIAETYDSGFPLSHDAYNGMIAASNGKIYYVLCSEEVDVAGQLYCLDPATQKITHVGDLTDACGEDGLVAIAQGQSPVNLMEHQGRLYFATHADAFDTVDGMKKIAAPTDGWKPYQGGHFVAYNMATGKFENLAIAPGGEGILAMCMDTQRGRLYGLTWPTGRFLRYDLAKKELKDLGPISLQGEAGKGDSYRAICRSLVVDPADGAVYFSTGDGAIRRYRYDRDAIETVDGENLKKDSFGQYNPATPGQMAYNWREVVWHPTEKVIYGVHGDSGYLFRFDPRAVRVKVLDRLASLPSQKSGVNNQLSDGCFGCTLEPDGRTLYCLVGGEAKSPGSLRLITFDISSAKFVDHGAIFFKDGSRPRGVNSVAVGKDGTVYALGQITANHQTRTDLIAIPAKSIALAR